MNLAFYLISYFAAGDSSYNGNIGSKMMVGTSCSFAAT